MTRVGMVSLGCSKNQVDAERMMAALSRAGMQIEGNPALCDAIIINTCGFIDAAKEESIDTILEYAELKGQENLKVVAVTGCLAERYREELAQAIPEADVMLGIGSNDQIVSAIQKALSGQRVVNFGEKTELSLEGERMLANDSYFAYLKIAEGCDNRCTYCAIPMIRGEFRSRPMENIIAEAKELAESGVTELNVVAQDSTRYGLDLYGELKLAELLEKLCEIPELRWIRVLYCYPERITDELIDVIAREDKIVKYLDIPIQHVSENVLKRMNRKGSERELRELIGKIRGRIDGVVIRTTLIAGFPGETQQEFEELCEFVEDMEFERLGCFAYSQEDDTPAAKFEDQIADETKDERCAIIMGTQMENALEFASSFIGETLEVLCEGYNSETDQYIGRTYMDAPEVDTQVLFTSNSDIEIGSYVEVDIIGSLDYDLIGENYGG